MKNLVSRFVKDESGATAIEYGLIAAGISVAIIAVVQGLGTKLTVDLHARFRTRSTKSRSTFHAEGSGSSGAFSFLRTRELTGSCRSRPIFQTIAGKSAGSILHLDFRLDP